MRKLFVFLFVATLLISGGVVFAEEHDLKNAEVFGMYGGPTGTSPATRIVRVRYAVGASASEANQANLASGDIVVWNTTSADGVTVSLATASSQPFAGVMVTSCMKAVTGDYSVDGSDRNWGWMAVQGYCHAQIDVSHATDGQGLRLNENKLNSFATDTNYMTQDIGTLLKEPAADGNGQVWLK